MKILHTSDWHLGSRLGNQDRLSDQFERLAELCEYIDREDVELLLVAGDVFDEHRAEALARIIGRLAQLLTPRIEAGLNCVFIAGNHDREHVFPLLSGLQELVAPTAGRQVVFADRPGLIPVTGHRGETISLMLLPYPTPVRYGLADQRWASPDLKRQDLASAVRSSIRECAAEAQASGHARPVVVSGHFLIRGIREGLYHLTEQDDIPLEAGDLPAYAYVALGHIHKPQMVGAPYIRYCGSLERMDRGEQHDAKEALLVEIGRSGLHDVRALPLRATPFAHCTVSSEADLQACADSIPERDRALVSLTFALRREQSLMALQSRARELFPRWYETRDVQWLDRPAPTARGVLEVNERDIAGSVRAYLQQALDDDPDRDDLLRLAEELLVEEELS